MPTHPRRVPIAIALILSLVFAQASAALAAAPIHLTERGSKVSSDGATLFARAPIHVTGA